jgi:indolepyruvate ferredoxin oxidoreductase beta subunit
MASHPRVTNVIVAGLGGQGVVRATDILAEAAFLAGRDVKKSEIHGMSQRGGSVSSDVRFGEHILSPMVPAGEADFLVVLDAGQVEANRPQLRPGGVLITPDWIEEKLLPHKRSLNVALLGALSSHLDFPEACWHAAIRAHLAEKLHPLILEAFALGRDRSQP